MEGPEVDSFRTVLKRAREVKLLPLVVQVEEFEGFLVKRLGSFNRVGCKRAMVSANIQDAERRLDAMKIQRQISPSTTSSRRRFRIAAVARDCSVVPLKGQLHLTKPAVTLECASSKRQCRREDFIPNCMEELQEVARITDIMCKAVQQWQREVAVGVVLSMVTNSVS